jgi:hypothetical protein
VFGFGETHVVSVVGPGISTTLAYFLVACRFSAVRLKR